MSFNFDEPIDRLGTHSVKYDLREARFGRADVTPLWVADMDFAAPPCVRAALAERAAHPIYGYTLADDVVDQSIIDWQWRRHRWRIEREWIVLLPGVVPGLSLSVQVLSAPGERVVIQPPVYHPFTQVIEANGRHVLASPLAWHEGQHRMQLDLLDAALTEANTPDTRLMLLCNPHNPGGRVWSRDELSALAEFCLRHGLTLVSDEIHADLVFPGHRHRPIASLAPDIAAQTITLSSPGKTFNTPGLNTAYAIIPNPALRRRYQHAVQALHLDQLNLFGLTAMQAAYKDGEPWLNALLETLRSNLEQARACLARHLPEVHAPMPEAGYLLWMDCRELAVKRGFDDAALHRFFIDAGLGLSPGVQFGEEGRGFMRMNVALPHEELLKALVGLKGY